MSKRLLTILITLSARRFLVNFAVGFLRGNSKVHAQIIRSWYYQLERELAEYRVRNGGKDADTSGYDAAESTEEKA